MRDLTSENPRRKGDARTTAAPRTPTKGLNRTAPGRRPISQGARPSTASVHQGPCGPGWSFSRKQKLDAARCSVVSGRRNVVASLVRSPPAILTCFQHCPKHHVFNYWLCECQQFGRKIFEICQKCTCRGGFACEKWPNRGARGGSGLGDGLSAGAGRSAMREKMRPPSEVAAAGQLPYAVLWVFLTRSAPFRARSQFSGVATAASSPRTGASERETGRR